MNEYMWVAEKVLAALIVAVPSSMLASNLALRKYRSEKWWDKRLSHHLDTIAALNDVIIYCDFALDVELEEVPRAKSQLDDLKEKYDQANVHLQSLVNISSLFYSPQVCVAIKELNSQMFSAERESDIYQKLGGLRESAESCLIHIVAIAQQDLHVK
ncbi:hypothetical protein ACOIWI_004172 [Vibrio vulnificus]|nr:hypothetical protein [Vibrio vulnificus]EHH1191888.1 hypothetical protein [Vibrio vulnificus]EHU4850500.1 hypothetical protein [Vibrio vulnificus]EKA7356678.1 hypothetical protein [Vibrio vulnificus]ELX4199888.1 hypothetical protein [Vibrio vulnificus]